MKSLGDAIQLRNRLIAHLEEADTECARAERPPLLTFVVAGGGFAGVETVASMNDFLRDAIPFYPNLREDMLRGCVSSSWRIHFAGTRGKARSLRRRKGARSWRGDSRQVESCDSEAAPNRTDQRREDHQFHIGLDGRYLTKPNPRSCRVCQGTRRIKVNPHLEVEGQNGLWALGDCALVPDPATGDYCPPTAQHASREGKVLAHNIIASVNGKPKKPFKFKTLGQLAAIGRRTGVARILGVNFSGFIAWFLWRGIYWSKLPRAEKKVRVAIDWALDVFFSKDFVQYLDQRALAASLTETGAAPWNRDQLSDPSKRNDRTPA